MTAGCSVAGGTECSAAGGTEGSVAGGIEYSEGSFLVGSAYCHPSPLCALPHSCKWDNMVPMSISL